MLLWLALVISIAQGLRGFEESDYYDDGSEPTVENPEWMAALNDSLSLAEVSMPGTHDTVSFYGGDLVQTQSWSLIGQLRAGVRFLDIRCRHYFDTLPIYHGSVYQYTFFDHVLQDVLEFLASFPTEAVIMRVKGEYIAEGNNETMFETVSKYLRIFRWNNFWLANRIPTLGECRGKIVIVQDFVGPVIGLQYSELNVEDHWEVWALFYWELDEKWNHIRRHLGETERGDKSKMYITFTCGVGTMAFPYAVAWRVNHRLLEYLVEEGQSLKRVGIIGMDFPGGRLIEKIIQINFQ